MGTLTASNHVSYKSYTNVHFEKRMIAAAEAGDISTLRKLIRKKIPTSVTDEYGNSPLSVACLGKLV